MTTYYNESICIVKESSEQTLIEMSISNGVCNMNFYLMGVEKLKQNFKNQRNKLIICLVGKNIELYFQHGFFGEINLFGFCGTLTHLGSYRQLI